MSSVAVVILNYNGKELLKKFLPGVIEHSGSARIIVADNNSHDGSMDLLTKEFPSIEIIPISSNLGFCGGYNYALQQVKADYYLLLNSDVEVTANWLTPLIDLLDGDDTIAAVQPKILSYHQKNKFEHAGAGGGFIDKLGYPFCRGRLFDQLEEDKDQYDDSVPVFWSSGACMLIRSSLFKSFNGFDETFFAHMEEIDLCWRLKREGHQIYYCGASQVYHMGGGTLSESNPRKTYYNFRNGLILLIKNLDPLNLAVTLPIRVILDTMAAFMFLAIGQGGNFMAVAKAHFFILTRLFGLLRKRTGSPYEVDLIYQGSIVFDYFLSGKSKFKELDFNNPK
ncbi:MAG TPA: glycosyltransferase family 2 protein [Cyclobacteriaceae bacterium]